MIMKTARKALSPATKVQEDDVLLADENGGRDNGDGEFLMGGLRDTVRFDGSHDLGEGEDDGYESPGGVKGQGRHKQLESGNAERKTALAKWNKDSEKVIGEATTSKSSRPFHRA
jgi:hypothetical protein